LHFPELVSSTKKAGIAFERSFNIFYSGNDLVTYPVALPLLIGKSSVEFLIAGKTKSLFQKTTASNFQKSELMINTQPFLLFKSNLWEITQLFLLFPPKQSIKTSLLSPY